MSTHTERLAEAREKNRIYDASELADLYDAKETQTDTQWMACCPCHNDRTPSLSITDKEGRAFVYCFAGCPTSEVLAAKGLTFQNLASGHSHVEAEYIYTDAAGAPVYKVQRREGKEFYQLHWDGKGWKWGNGQVSLLYRLPKVIEAVKRNETIYITEGEKDAEYLETIGCTATTLSGGVLKNLHDKRLLALSPISGARVVILPDQDPVGIQSGRLLASYLMRSAQEIRIINPPNGKKDVAEWRCTKEELDEAVASVDLFPTPVDSQCWTAAKLKHAVFPEPKWIVPGILTEGLTVFAGAQKIGKSWMALGLADSLSVGGTYLGRTLEEREVLYMALEDTLRRLQGRMKMINGRWAEKLHFEVTPPTQGETVPYLQSWMTAHPKTALIVIDTLQKVWDIKDSNDYREVSSAISTLKAFADEAGIALMVIHHTKKGETEDYVHRVIGSVGIVGVADTIMVLTRGRGQGAAELAVTGRDIEEHQFALKFSNGRWEMVGDADAVRMTEERKEIRMLLLGSEGMTPNEIARALGKVPSTVRGLIMKMKDQDLVTQLPDGKYTVRLECEEA